MTMPIMRAGLIVASLGFLYVSWASTGAGFPIEIAVVRGMLAFMALSFLAYVGELVVATAPRVAAEEAAGAEAEAEADGGSGSADAESLDADDGMATDADAAGGGRFAVLAPTPTENDNDELQAA